MSIVLSKNQLHYYNLDSRLRAVQKSGDGKKAPKLAPCKVFVEAAKLKELSDALGAQILRLSDAAKPDF